MALKTTMKIMLTRRDHLIAKLARMQCGSEIPCNHHTRLPWPMCIRDGLSQGCLVLCGLLRCTCGDEVNALAAAKAAARSEER